MSPTAHIVLVEDNPAHAELARRSLARAHPSMQVQVCGTLAEARRVFQERPPDCAIVDIKLPDGDGLSLLPGSPGEGDFPVLVMTSQGDTRAAVEAMRLGALDYVPKSEQFYAELPAVLRRVRHQWKNIVQRRVAEAARKRSEARMATILDVSPDAIICCDEAERVRIFNQGAERIFGYTAREILGQELSRLLPDGLSVGESWPRILPGPEGARRMGRLQRVSALRKDGTAFPAAAAVTHTPVDDEIVLTISLRDRTEEIQREAALRQAQKMEAVGHLTGGVAHDFNNVLTVVLMNTALLIDSGTSLPESERHAMLQEAYQAAQRGSSLVRRLLAFSRKEESTTEAVQLRDLAEGMLGMLRSTLGRSIRFRTQLAPDTWACAGDSSQLENVLLNLCINARDAMPEGGELVIETSNRRCEARQTPSGDLIAPGDYVSLTVRDTGSGMSEDVLGQIFVPFFTTKPAGKGTGLGLSMVHATVTQSRGHVWVESEPGVGTSISVRLPRLVGQVEEVPVEAEVPQPHPHIRMLIVDDDGGHRRVARRVLRGHGIDCLEAASAAEALRLLEGEPGVDVVLADYAMPGSLTGLGLQRKIQQRWPKIAVVLATGSIHKLLQETADPLVPVFAKPYDVQELVQTVRGMVIQQKR